MKNRWKRFLSGVIATMMVAQVMIAGDGSTVGFIKAFAETIGDSSDKAALAENFDEAVEGLGGIDYFSTAELATLSLPVYDSPEVSNALTVSGYAKLDNKEDSSKVKIYIFDSNWALRGETTANADGSFSVTASGLSSTDTHVKIECDGYLPRYYSNLGYGSYDIGENSLIPGDTTYNAGANNQWSDDVLDGSDAAYVHSFIGLRKGYSEYNTDYDLNNDGIIDAADATVFNEQHYDTHTGDAGYLAALDIDQDGHIYDMDYNFIYRSYLNSEDFKDYMDIDGDCVITESDYQYFNNYVTQYNGFRSGDYEYYNQNDLTLTDNCYNANMSVYNTYLDLNGYSLKIDGTFNFMTSNPNVWTEGDGSTLYLNGGSLYVGDYFNFGQANCYDLIVMKNEKDEMRIDGNWMYTTLADCEGYWIAGKILFYGQHWNVNETSGDKAIYSSGTHKIVFYYPYGKQTVLWANTETYLDDNGNTSTGRRFNFDYMDEETGECLGVQFPYGYSSDLYWFRPWFREAEEPDYTMYRNGWEIGYGVHIASGNFTKSFKDLSITSPGVTSDFIRTYNSMNAEEGSFGVGWDFNIDVSKIIIPTSGYYQVVLPDGSNTTFKDDGNGGYECLNAHSKMAKDGSDYVVTNSAQSKYYFNSNNKLYKVMDANGNKLLISDIENNIRTVTDSTGRTYKITYNGNSQHSRITKIEDSAANRTVTYQYDSDLRLISATNVSDGTEKYEYDGNGRLSKITNCYNEVTDQVNYLSHGEVNYVTNASGLKQIYTYDKGQKQTGVKEYDGDALVKTYKYDYDEKQAVKKTTVTVKENGEDKTYTVDNIKYNLIDGKNKYNEVSESTDIMGNITKYDRDNNGNVTKTTNPDSTYTLAKYNDQNKPVIQVDENKNVIIYKYDNTGINVLEKYQSLSTVGNADALAANTDKAFNFSQINSGDYAITIYDYYDYSENSTTKIIGLVESITDPEGHVTVYTYNESGLSNGLPETKTIKDGNTVISRVEYKYNPQLQTSEEKTSVDIANNIYSVKKYEYDKFNNNTKTEDYGTGSTAAVTLTEYDKLGRKTAEYAPNYSFNKSKGTLYTYNPDDSIKTQTNAEGNVTSFAYDAYGNVTSKTNPNGTINLTYYDNLQREIKTSFKTSTDGIEQVLTATSYEVVRNYGFDVYTNLDTSSSKSCSGLKTTRTTYISAGKSVAAEVLTDFRGNTITEKTNGNLKRTSAYYANGQPARQTDALGNITKYEYNTLNKLTKTYTPFDDNSNSVTENKYDKNGNITEVKQTVQKQDSANVKYSITENEYNALGLLTKVTLSGTGSSDKNITKYFYNNAGIKTKMYTGLSSDSDLDYLTTEYTYDNWNRIVTTSDSTGYNSGTITYDLNSNILTVTDANNNVTTNTYDALNRLLTANTVNSADSSKNISKSFVYDNMGRITSNVCNEKTTSYEYDSLGRKIKEYGSAFKGFFYIGASQYVDHSIVGISNLLIYSDTSYVYDGEMRVQAVKESGNLTASYTYDANGNKESETLANGITSTYTYNNNNKIASITNKLGNVPISTYGYSYYLDGSDACKTRTENGIIEKTSYEYDGLKRLTEESVAVGSNTTDTFAYEYDDYGNRILMTSFGTENYSTAYNYNNSDGDYTALLQKEVKTLSNGSGLVPNDNIKMTSYTYDANGNQVTKTTDEKIETNTYDGLNQMIGYTDGTTTASYTYNAEGLRASKTVAGETVDHVWDGNQQVIADIKDGNIYEADCYVRGTNLVAKYSFASAQKSDYNYYIQNAHGDVVNLAGSDGTVTKTYKYDAFGVEKNISDTDTNAFRYCGEYYDKETGTIYLRARNYDPSIGRFISRDSFAGKGEDPLSLNLYTYCHNNPVLGIDPTGHFLDTLFDAVSLVVDVVEFVKEPTPMGAANLLCDVVGLVTPGVPSAGLKLGVKAVGATVDAVKAADKINDVRKAVEVVDDIHDTAETFDNITDAGRALNNTTDALKQGKNAFSDSDLVNAANEIHGAQYGDAWWGKKNPISVTAAGDGSIIVSKNNGIPGPKSRAKAMEIFGDDVKFAGGKNANLSASINGVTEFNHAEARGVQYMLNNGINPNGARQATTLLSCPSCTTLQRHYSIRNLTGLR